MAEIIHKLSFDFSEYKSSNVVFLDENSTEDILEVSFYSNGFPFLISSYEATLHIDITETEVICGAYLVEGNTAKFRLRRSFDFVDEWTLCEVQLGALGGNAKEIFATQNFLIYLEKTDSNIEYDKTGNYLTRSDIEKIKTFDTLRLIKMPDAISYPNGTIVQYIGDDTEDYTTGYFYQTQHISSTFAVWRQKNVQPALTATGTDLLNHNNFNNRNSPFQHPIRAISYLNETLNYFANSELSSNDIDEIISEIEVAVSEVYE
ncbi:MAG: hypothetical protein IJA34_01030 [Lachnospiraceae bacterium]|nr:hypothetical protein [Lachnospiraceae bacterium]